jgi:hypothetical protein
MPPDCANHLGIIGHQVINNGTYWPWPPFEILPKILDMTLGLDGMRGYLEETERIFTLLIEVQATRRGARGHLVNRPQAAVCWRWWTRRYGNGGLT